MVTSSFSQYHPVAVFLYIAAAIICAMLTLHPVYVVISIACGSAYALYLGGARKYAVGLRPMLVMFALIAIINPLTNHRGATTLFYIWDNPVTREALVYGICVGGMLLCVLIWFMCYRHLITNDKFMYLFGRAAPTSSMVISMILKLIPVLSQKMSDISNQQKALGMVDDSGDGDNSHSGDNGSGGTNEATQRSRIKLSKGSNKIRNGMRVSGILISRAMEDSIDTADSMRARGYGTGTRTSFARYRLHGRDIAVITILSALFAVNIVYIFFGTESVGGGGFRFFPFIAEISTDPLPYVIYAALLLFPLADETINSISMYVRERRVPQTKGAK